MCFRKPSLSSSANQLFPTTYPSDIEFSMLDLQVLESEPSSKDIFSQASNASPRRSSPSGGRGRSSGHPSGIHIHFASQTEPSLLGGIIEMAMLCARGISVFARAEVEKPTVVPSWNSSLNQPFSVFFPSETISSLSPKDHLTFFPVKSTDDLSRTHWIHSEGASGSEQEQMNPPSQEKKY